MKRVAAYLRRSRAEAGQDESASIATQREKVHQAAKLEGWTIAEEFVDDGYSGGSTDRPEFQRLLAKVKRRQFDVVIVYKLDRWSRSVADFHATWELLRDNGCGFLSVVDRFDTESESGRLMMSIIASFAEFERASIRRRSVDGKRNAMSQGRYIARPPVGYDKDENQQLHQNADAKAVRFIFREYAKGTQSVHTVASKAAAKYPTRLDGKRWKRANVLWILKNPRYCGDIISRGKVVVKDAFEPLVDRETFAKVQSQLAKNSYTMRADRCYIFSGLARCGHCGKTLVGSSSGCSKRYMRCRAGGVGCELTTVSEKVLIEHVQRRLKGIHSVSRLIEDGKLLNTPEEIEVYREHYGEVLNLFVPDAPLEVSGRPAKAIQKDIDSTRRKLDKAVAQALEGEELGQAFKRQVERLERTLTELKQELFEVQNAEQLAAEHGERLTKRLDICAAYLEGGRSREWMRTQTKALVEYIEVLNWTPPEGYEPGDYTWEQVKRTSKRQKKKGWTGKAWTCETRIKWCMV